jgi:hypothetical protein
MIARGSMRAFITNSRIVYLRGDAREAVKALLVADEFLEREIDEKVSRGYLRGVRHGRLNTYSG